MASSSILTTPFSPPSISSRRQLPLSIRQKPRFVSPLCLASSSAAPIATWESEIELENRKYELLRAVTNTQRGLKATPDQRSSIEEALVSVESFDAGKPIDLNSLDGTWRLQYTSASDVLILFQSAATLPFFEVDQIFQKFECRDQSSQGVVRNIVKWSVPRLLEEQEGATLIVSAKFSVVSIRHIYLEFEEIAVQNINISEELQALLAPAILPRSFLSLRDMSLGTLHSCPRYLRTTNGLRPLGSSKVLLIVERWRLCRSTNISLHYLPLSFGSI